MHPYIRIFGRIIGTYGICMMIGIMLSAFLAIRRGKKLGVVQEDILIIAASAVGLALICGSLLYIFVTYPFSTLIAMIKSGDFASFRGGIVFYGGLIGGILGAILGSRIAKVRRADIVPAVVPFVPLGHAVGRVGCVMAGCCHGMEYDGIFALHYPHSMLGLNPEQGYFPVQLLESLMNLVICGALLFLAKRFRRNIDMLFAYLSMYALTRFILEYFRGDEARGIYLCFSLSQWISIGLMIVGVLGICLPKCKKHVTE